VDGSVRVIGAVLFVSVAVVVFEVVGIVVEASVVVSEVITVVAVGDSDEVGVDVVVLGKEVVVEAVAVVSEVVLSEVVGTTVDVR